MKKIKIMAVFHKPYNYIKSDLIVPIHAGRDVAFEKNKDGVISKENYDWLLKNTLGDNLGDNISKLNRKYCENTVTYFASKNLEKLGNPDYIGLMHYRTFFNLYNYADSNNLKTNLLCFNAEVFDKLLDEYDGVILEHWNYLELTKEPFGAHLEAVKPVDADFIEKEAPQLKEAFQRFSKTGGIHYKNMYILKREDFLEYSEILFKLANVLINKGYYLEDRAIGYACEFLSSLIFDYLIINKKRKFYAADVLEIPEDMGKIKIENIIKYYHTLLKIKIFKNKKEHYNKKLALLTAMVPPNIPLKSELCN